MAQVIWSFPIMWESWTEFLALGLAGTSPRLSQAFDEWQKFLFSHLWKILKVSIFNKSLSKNVKIITESHEVLIHISRNMSIPCIFTPLNLSQLSTTSWWYSIIGRTLITTHSCSLVLSLCIFICMYLNVVHVYNYSILYILVSTVKSQHWKNLPPHTCVALLYALSPSAFLAGPNCWQRQICPPLSTVFPFHECYANRIIQNERQFLIFSKYKIPVSHM